MFQFTLYYSSLLRQRGQIAAILIYSCEQSLSLLHKCKFELDQDFNFLFMAGSDLEKKKQFRTKLISKQEQLVSHLLYCIFIRNKIFSVTVCDIDIFRYTFSIKHIWGKKVNMTFNKIFIFSKITFRLEPRLFLFFPPILFCVFSLKQFCFSISSSFFLKVFKAFQFSFFGHWLVSSLILSPVFAPHQVSFVLFCLFVELKH